MVKGTVEFTWKLVGMDRQPPLAETARPVGFVLLVEPDFALHLED